MFSHLVAYDFLINVKFFLCKNYLAISPLVMLLSLLWQSPDLNNKFHETYCSEKTTLYINILDRLIKSRDDAI